MFDHILFLLLKPERDHPILTFTSSANFRTYNLYISKFSIYTHCICHYFRSHLVLASEAGAWLPISHVYVICKFRYVQLLQHINSGYIQILYLKSFDHNLFLLLKPERDHPCLIFTLYTYFDNIEIPHLGYFDMYKFLPLNIFDHM